MYTCGPTVYNYAHLGNLRSYVFADTLKRTLEYIGYSTEHVINITDVGHLVSDADEGEDKLEKGALREGRSAQEISAFYTKEFFHDLDILNIDRKKIIFPRATDYIKEQITLIQKLEEKGHTYKTSDGIYFDTSTFPTYGSLGGINLDSIKEGARIGINAEKKNPTDFALWKLSGNKKRQQEWDSPWGTGFPGWHIECSAMAMSILGEELDIHTGGIDHVPVHHNNEIAQSESATGKTFSQFWLHNEFLTTQGEKMSKSQGNFLRMQLVIDEGFHPLSYRYFCLTAHYRTPLTFSWEALSASETAFRRLSLFLSPIKNTGTADEYYVSLAKKHLADDLNTASTLALLWEIVKDNALTKEDRKATILDIDKALGLDLRTNYFEKEIEIPHTVQELLERRKEAREQKNWSLSDEIRDEIRTHGFIVQDTPSGQEVTKE